MALALRSFRGKRKFTLDGLRGPTDHALSYFSLRKTEAVWVFVGQCGSLLGSLVALKVLTTVLPRAVYGKLVLLTGAMLLPNWILFAPILHATIRMFGSHKESGGIRTLIGTATAIYSVVSGLCIVAAVVILCLHITAMSLTPLEIVAALVLLVLESWQLLGLGIAAAARQRTRVALLSSANSLGKPVMAVIMLASLGPSLQATLCAYIVATSTVAVIAMYPYRAMVVECFSALDAETFRSMVRYGGPISATSALAWLQNYSDRYIVALLLGASDVAVYAAGYQICYVPFNTLSSLLTQLFVPIAFERAGDGATSTRVMAAHGTIMRYIGLFAVVSTALVVLIFCFGGRLVTLLTSSRYNVPSRALLFFGAGAVCFNCAQMLLTSLLIENRTAQMFLTYVVPSLAAVPVLIGCTSLYRLEGAAAGNALISAAYVCCVGIAVRKRRSARRRVLEGHIA